jgi:hypothetical protein
MIIRRQGAGTKLQTARIEKVWLLFHAPKDSVAGSSGDIAAGLTPPIKTVLLSAHFAVMPQRGRATDLSRDS